ncbi:MAG: hypothetical protein H7A45_20930 [Verrucomicrobiales bacterium]|nr:hypothetical protein [Verrucomicrobiales bacterium]
MNTAFLGYALLSPAGPLRLHGQNEPPLLAPCFGDNMMLRVAPARDPADSLLLWGWVPDGQKVSVRFSTHSKDLTVSDYEPGRRRGFTSWRLTSRHLEEPLKAGGPFSLTITPMTPRFMRADVRGTARVFTNLLAGEVWIASPAGRPSPRMGGGPLPDAVRLLRVGQAHWGDLKAPLLLPADVQGWALAGDGSGDRGLPASIRYFAMAYRRHYPDMPLGIILVPPSGDREPIRSHALNSILKQVYDDELDDYHHARRAALEAKRRGVAVETRIEVPKHQLVRAEGSVPSILYGVDGCFW